MRDRKSEPSAGDFLAWVTTPFERLNDAISFIIGDAGAVVGDSDVSGHSVVAVRGQMHYRARWRIAHRVLQQFGHRATYFIEIDDDGQRVGLLKMKSDLARVEQPLERVRDMLHDNREVAVRPCELGMAVQVKECRNSLEEASEALGGAEHGVY